MVLIKLHILLSLLYIEIQVFLVDIDQLPIILTLICFPRLQSINTPSLPFLLTILLRVSPLFNLVSIHRFLIIA